MGPGIPLPRRAQVLAGGEKSRGSNISLFWSNEPFDLSNKKRNEINRGETTTTEREMEINKSSGGWVAGLSKSCVLSMSSKNVVDRIGSRLAGDRCAR